MEITSTQNIMNPIEKQKLRLKLNKYKNQHTKIMQTENNENTSSTNCNTNKNKMQTVKQHRNSESRINLHKIYSKYQK